MEEIREALQWTGAARNGLQGVTVLHCTSAYPAPDTALNLTAIMTLRGELGVDIGYSDHSLGIEAPLAAVALGAIVIEKHITLDRSLPGPDHRASLEPEEFKRMTAGIRRVSAMRGDGVKAPTPQERDTARVARRSLAAARAIPAGSMIEANMLMCRRPATGIAPRELGQVVGRRARVPIPAETVLQWDQLEDESSS
jgi:sialic acid synthase SpsE